ncbi:hypothetical protein [Streptomyces sp. NPDC085932]|uniref:hypothetical protein n=1 Tax=Streptomyces sp. NPDC085932 TaxID=3365741 RepID=UPI0037D5523D
MIDVDKDEAPALVSVAGKDDETGGASNRIILHSREPLKTFITYLRRHARHPVVNQYEGHSIHLLYGHYLAPRGSHEPPGVKSPLNAVDMGWGQGTLNPSFELPNTEAKTKIKIFNLAAKAFTMLLSPKDAVQMAAEHTVLRRDYYLIIAGRKETLGLKGEETRISLADWSVTEGENVKISFGDVADALQEHEKLIDHANAHTLERLLKHLKEHHKKHEVDRYHQSLE